jgi:hypothetical protein
MRGRAREIARLNDHLRQTFTGGKVVMTQGVASLSEETRVKLLGAVRTFTAFTADNDPHGEHDFGSFEVEGAQFFFKIDCYDTSLDYGSADPADSRVTTCVLTIMLASEY